MLAAMGWIWGAAVIGFVLLVPAVMYYVNRFRTDRRREQLADVARALGLRFDPDGYVVPRRLLESFRLFQGGGYATFSNALHGRFEDSSLYLFDCQIRVRSSDGDDLWCSQTVAVFVLPAEEFPALEVWPETVVDRVGQWLGSRDIDFDSNPAFSDMYVVRGADEAAVRRIMTPAVMEDLREHPGWSIAASGRVIMFYQHNRLRTPADLKRFRGRVLDLLRAFDIVTTAPPESA